MPKETYGGHSFHMVNNNSDFAYTMMTVEELNGEGINDAIHNRNIKVADELDITITETMLWWDQVTSTMNTAITAGDKTYDCFWNESQYVAPFAIAGNLYNVHDMTAIDTEKPWWDGEVLDDITFGDNLYFLVGDLHLMFKESFWMCGFNKNLLDTVNLGDPYELVREGTWTMDHMRQYMSAVKQDTNGDGTMDGADLFGATCYGGCVPAFMLAADENFIERDESGIPVIVSPDDRFYAVYEKLINTMFAPEIDFVCIQGKTTNMKTDWHGMFSSGQALFYLEPIGSLKKLRDMDAEFGIVPFPKYDEVQENYVTYIAKYAAFCGVPITSEDPHRTGVILENLCANSHGDLRKAYAETTLNFKYIRDRESAEMLNVILESGSFNLADILDATSLMDTVTDAAMAADLGLSSRYAKLIRPLNKVMEKTVKSLIENK